MTNEEAKLTIDYLKKMQEGYIEVEGCERHPLPEWYALDKAIEAIRQTEWTPISEGLPEKDGEYLLFGKICEDDEDCIFRGDYDSDCEQFGIWEEQHDRTTLGSLGSEFYEYASVIAWMPLPEPYKAEREGWYV